MNNAALDRVLKCPTLPSLPGVAMEVLELTRDKNVPLRRIAEVVQNDQALAVKILKTVNSSYYGLRKPCPTISRAMAYLGIETVKSLVLGFSLIDVVGQQTAEDFDFVSFWRRCIYGATGARTFATVTRAYDSEEAFIAALLQDVGMLAMRMAMGKAYSDAIAPSARDHNRTVELEREAYGFDHQVAGSALADKWRLPPQLIETIAHHHQPKSVQGEHRTLVRLVALANLATQAMDAGAKSSLPARYVEQAREWFRIPADEAISMLEGISDNARELSRLFHLDTGPKVDLLEIQAMANELLTEHQLEVQAQSRQLRQSN
ncbi:MAG: HDOD domain-containing protein, partial [Phycisphaerales bacterium]|nr:HDOD domain-containing protein [Phycisphaerales bacterium]